MRRGCCSICAQCGKRSRVYIGPVTMNCGLGGTLPLTQAERFARLQVEFHEDVGAGVGRRLDVLRAEVLEAF